MERKWSAEELSLSLIPRPAPVESGITQYTAIHSVWDQQLYSIENWEKGAPPKEVLLCIEIRCDFLVLRAEAFEDANDSRNKASREADNFTHPH